MTQMFRSIPRRGAFARPLVLTLLLWSCDGGNGWQELPTGPGQSTDRAVPAITILQPQPGTAVAARDSILVSVRVTDNQGVDSVRLSGYALRGSLELGTGTRVDRFAPKAIAIGAGVTVRDTTISRYLVATADSASDTTAYIVVRARDRAGNASLDSVRLSVTPAPRVRILAPRADSVVSAGGPLTVRFRADNAATRVGQVTVRLSGGVSDSTLLTYAAGPAGVTDSTTFNISERATGPIRIVVSERDVSGAVKAVDSLTVRARDRTTPTVEFLQPASGSTVAIGDSVLVEVSVRDVQGLASVDLSGYQLVGDSTLGTRQRVPRFLLKAVNLLGQDSTVVRRWLLPTGSGSAADSVFLQAVVRDTAGNVATATRRVSVGGPRVRILSPTDRATAGAGSRISLSAVAVDRTDLLRRVVIRLRSEGGGADSVVREFPGGQDSVTVTFPYDIPSATVGDVRIQAEATSLTNVRAVSPEVILRVTAPVLDTSAPSVRFSVTSASRVESGDTLTITVNATDNIRVDTVGVTIRPVITRNGQAQTLGARRRSVPGEAGTFRFTALELGVLGPLEEASLSLEVTAYAKDTAGNCGAATVPNVSTAAECRIAADTVFARTPGALTNLQVVRGGTIRATPGVDRFVDIAADSIGRRIFVSNHSRNRVEVLPIGAPTFAQPILVGSEPWGLALGLTSDTLFVANSGGTNISVVGLSSLAESRRIRTPDIRLYSMSYNVEKDSVLGVTEQDFSDRPQFLGQISSGQLLYSTKPTSTREPGTLRIFDPAKDTTNQFNRATEIFVQYASPQTGRGIVVNALSAGLSPNQTITVCPRRRLASQADPACVNGSATTVRVALDNLRAAGATDTRLELNRAIESVALTDTTFVGVSGDHSTVVFGEGATDPGRVFLFRNQGGALVGSTSETADLLGNAAERVIGLSLNADGSLGAARGRRSYYFENNLRLQGVVESGPPSGGIALHPLNAGYPGDDGRRRGFVSGTTAEGASYVDIVDTFTFRTVRRVFVRDQIVGSLVAAPVTSADPEAGRVAIRIFAITARGVLQLDLTAADLQ